MGFPVGETHRSGRDENAGDLRRVVEAASERHQASGYELADGEHPMDRKR